MKINRNIEVVSKYDQKGCIQFCVKKQKGRFTLDEIIEAAKKIGFFDCFAVLVIDLRDQEDNDEFANEGDFVKLYDYREVWRENE